MSGGHAINPGFSSTKGIHIYLRKFSQVTYDATSGTVVIGSGLIWDTVYEQLQEHSVITVGGRVTGVSERRDSSSRFQSYYVTDWRWWLRTRWRLALHCVPLSCILTAHQQDIPTRPISTAFQSTAPSASIWFCPMGRLHM